MLFGIFENVESKEKSEAIEGLIRRSSPSQDYFLMVIFSISMATLALLLDSLIVLIGSMLLAPVLYPVIGIGMGIAIFDGDLIVRSAYTLVQSFVVALLFAVLLGMIFSDQHGLNLDIVNALRNIEAYAMYLVVSVIAGLAASFSLVKPELSESFPGIAVAVSLVPPLALAGLAGTHMDVPLTIDMLTLFGSNVVGIIAGSTITFLFMNFHVKRKVAEKAIEEEEEELEEEQEA